MAERRQLFLAEQGYPYRIVHVDKTARHMGRAPSIALGAPDQGADPMGHNRTERAKRWRARWRPASTTETGP